MFVCVLLRGVQVVSIAAVLEFGVDGTDVR